MPVCVHASLPPSLLGRPSVIGYREARPCQARVVRTLYSCEARRWVHGTQRGEGSCARCVRTMRIMLCYVMLCVCPGSLDRIEGRCNKNNCCFFPCVAIGIDKEMVARHEFNTNPLVVAWVAQRNGGAGSSDPSGSASASSTRV